MRSRDEGVAAAKAGRFAAGDVVVQTGLGLRGSPGMGLTSALMFAIDGAGLSTSVAVITDGQMSGLVNGGLVIAEVSPEGAAGGPLGLVRDGDLISIDVNARTVDLEVKADELAARRASLPPLAAPTGCGWLSVYARSVAPLGSGATLGACSAGLGDRADGGRVGAVVGPGGGLAARGRKGSRSGRGPMAGWRRADGRESERSWAGGGLAARGRKGVGAVVGRWGVGGARTVGESGRTVR